MTRLAVLRTRRVRALQEMLSAPGVAEPFAPLSGEPFETRTPLEPAVVPPCAEIDWFEERGALEQIDPKLLELLPQVQQPGQTQIAFPETEPRPAADGRRPFSTDTEHPGERRRVTDPPGHVCVERPAVRKERPALPLQAEDGSIPASKPENLRHLPKLPLERQLHQQQPVRHQHVPEHTGLANGIDAAQSIDHVAGRHVAHRLFESDASIVDAGRLELPGTFVVQDAVGSDALVARVRQHHLRVPVKHLDQRGQPAWMPDVVVAGPGEILGVRRIGQRQLERPAPVVDHAQPGGVAAVDDAGVLRRVALDDVAGRIGRLVVDAHQPELAIRLDEQRFQRFRQIVGVVVQRYADDDSRAAHWSCSDSDTRRQPTTCLYPLSSSSGSSCSILV